MGKRLLFSVAIAWHLAISGPVHALAETRIWTGTNGTKIEADYVDVSVDKTRVALRKPDGKIVKTKIANLIESDRVRIKGIQRLQKVEKGKKAEKDYATGVNYYLGTSVRRDFSKAIEYYKRAARAGHRDATFSLGLCYSNGRGVEKDLRQARVNYESAAQRGHVGAQNNLAMLLGNGQGGEKDQDGSLYWYRKAAAAGSPEAMFNIGLDEWIRKNETLAADYFMRSGQAYHKAGERDGVLRCVDKLRKLNAHVLAKSLSNQLYGVNAAPRPTPNASVPSSSGTGWFCSPQYVVTCWHVLDGHDRFYLISDTLAKTPLKLVAKDRQNDLAVLQMPSHDLSLHGSLPLSGRLPAIAEKVFTSGFPHVNLLGKAPKYTEGSVSATSGIDDDPRILQISVPVQSGNSGGPLLDNDGRVTGIVASKLAAARVFKWTGDLPQNINYAVKIAYLRALLDAKGIKYASDPTWPEGISRSELIKKVNDAIVLILAE